MIYESENDRRYQDRCQWVLEYAGFEVKQSSTTMPWDMSLKRNGQPYAIVEYKTRHELYPTLKIDKDKIDSLIDLSEKHKVKPILIVHWPKIGGYWAWVCNRNAKVSLIKRMKPRGIAGEAPEAVDVCYSIPRSEFICI